MVRMGKFFELKGGIFVWVKMKWCHRLFNWKFL